MQCSRCGHDLPSTARFCPTCGTTTAAAPIPPGNGRDAAPTRPPEELGAVEIGTRPPRSVAPFVMTGLVLAALVAGGIAVIGTRGDDTTADGGQAGGASPATVATSPPDSSAVTIQPTTPATTVDTTTTTSTITLPPDPNMVALEGLDETIDADRPSVDTHLGRWVPQISAKRDGIRWEGVDYDLPLILELHRELDARYGALLVSGAEYTFKIDESPMTGWYITIVDESHASPDGALEWCRQNDIDRENCAAKLITNDPDPGQTLVLQ